MELQSERQTTLVVMTASFPFGTKEAYLEAELPHLSRAFDVVPIYPHYYNSSSKKSRPVPRNVIVHHPPVPRGSLNRLVAFCRGILRMPPIRAWLKEFFNAKLYLSIAHFQVWLYTLIDFVITSTSQQAEELQNHTTATYYFYWGQGWAYVLPFLRTTNPIFLRLHGGEVFVERSQGYIPQRLPMFEGCTHILAISELVKRYLQREYNVPANKILVSRLGTPDCGLSIYPDPRSPICIVSVANSIPLKRIELIIHSLAICNESITWHHIGDGESQNDLQSLARSLLSTKIQFTFHGRLPNHSVLKFFKTVRVDCFVNTSAHEGLPVSIMEAMSFGIPAIATDVGATNEIVNTSTGFLLPPDFQPHLLAKQIDDLRSPIWLERRASARQKWENTFSANTNFSLLVKQLQQALDEV